MKEVVIVHACRTAVGRSNGALAHTRADELLANVLDAAVTDVGIEKDAVDDIIVGCVTQIGEQAMNIARTSALIAGFPESVPGVTIDRQCGSSQQAIHFAAQAIASGDMDIVIAGGVETMSRHAMFANVGDTKASPLLHEKHEIVNQGVAAEKIAEQWGFTREELDLYSFESHERALRAIETGQFEEEIIPLEATDENGDPFRFDVDEGPRRDTSLEKLGQLKPVFMKNGMITAGNASQMSDGASAVVVMSRDKADELGIQPRARILVRTVVGSNPTLMLTGPIQATERALERANLTIDAIDLYEVNEAFAPVPLAWLHDLKADREKLNVNGGAIALGHPLGATGTKLMTTLLHALEKQDKRYGLLAICEGMGMANATIIERIRS